MKKYHPRDSHLWIKVKGHEFSIDQIRNPTWGDLNPIKSDLSCQIRLSSVWICICFAKCFLCLETKWMAFSDRSRLGRNRFCTPFTCNERYYPRCACQYTLCFDLLFIAGNWADRFTSGHNTSQGQFGLFLSSSAALLLLFWMLVRECTVVFVGSRTTWCSSHQVELWNQVTSVGRNEVCASISVYFSDTDSTVRQNFANPSESSWGKCVQSHHRSYYSGEARDREVCTCSLVCIACISGGQKNK